MQQPNTVAQWQVLVDICTLVQAQVVLHLHLLLPKMVLTLCTVLAFFLSLANYVASWHKYITYTHGGHHRNLHWRCFFFAN